MNGSAPSFGLKRLPGGGKRFATQRPRRLQVRFRTSPTGEAPRNPPLDGQIEVLHPYRVSLLFAMALLLCPAAQAQQQPVPQVARIVGSVLDETGAPVRDAIAVLDSARYRQTDARGRFRFDSLALGTYRLEVRSIGYSPVVAMLRLAAGTTDAVIRLRSGAHLLPEVLVKARDLRLDEVGYYRRRGEEHGRFVETDSLLRLDSLDLVLALSRLPGFRLKAVGAQDPDVASHSCRRGFRLWVNGWEIDSSDKAYFLRTTHPRDLAGAEIYEEGMAPLVFTGKLPGDCVLAIWEH
jgi:carboxypeptidase family protein